MEDAAKRVLVDKAGLPSLRITFQETITPIHDEDKEHYAIYTTTVPSLPKKPESDDISEFFFHTEDELKCIYNDFKDFLTPRLKSLLAYEFDF